MGIELYFFNPEQSVRFKLPMKSSAGSRIVFLEFIFHQVPCCVVCVCVCVWGGGGVLGLGWDGGGSGVSVRGLPTVLPDLAR